MEASEFVMNVDICNGARKDGADGRLVPKDLLEMMAQMDKMAQPH